MAISESEGPDLGRGIDDDRWVEVTHMSNPNPHFVRAGLSQTAPARGFWRWSRWPGWVRTTIILLGGLMAATIFGGLRAFLEYHFGG